MIRVVVLLLAVLAPWQAMASEADVYCLTGTSSTGAPAWAPASARQPCPIGGTVTVTLNLDTYAAAFPSAGLPGGGTDGTDFRPFSITLPGSSGSYALAVQGTTGGVALPVTGTVTITLPSIAPNIGGSAISTLGLKTTGGGNLYGVYANSTSAGWLMVFNSTSATTNGSTTAGTASGNVQDCVPIPANGYASINYNPGPPEMFSTGIYAAISSTPCGTLTLETTGFIHGSVQ